MFKSNSALAALVSSTALFVSGCATAEPASVTQMASPAPVASTSAQDLSITVLEFGGPNLLFAADQASNKVFAFELGDLPDETGNLESVPYNLTGFGQSLASHLGVSPFDIVYNDLAVHPVTKAAILSVSIGGGNSAVVMVTPDGAIRTLDLTSLPHSSMRLGNTPDEDVSFWRDIPATSLSVTDFEYDDGTLYIAGLSTGEFASTLRQVSYPFDGSPETTSIEMFHTAHNQNETRAPIRAMAMADFGGEKTLVAAYTCTPLVTIPEGALEDGAHVVGKTIAELGYGNRPLEVLSLTAYNMERQPEDFVLVINREMSANLIRVEDMAGAPGLTTAFSGLGDTLGIQGTHVPFAGTLQAADQDAQFILTLRRNIDTGDVDLISSMKGVYFRLSDFVSEYTFPDYTYGENQTGTKMFHNMVKPIEGYAELVIE